MLIPEHISYLIDIIMKTKSLIVLVTSVVIAVITCSFTMKSDTQWITVSGYVDNTNHIVESIRFSPQEYGLASKKDATEWSAYLENLITGWLADGTMAQIIEDNGVVASFTE